MEIDAWLDLSAEALGLTLAPGDEARVQRRALAVLAGIAGESGEEGEEDGWFIPVGEGPLQPIPEELAGVERFMVAFSGGKDSVACVLYLLDIGVPKEKIELWHYMMDDPDSPLMDWPVTEAYCRAFADAMGLPILFAGRVGGFEGEMLREVALPGAIFYHTPDGERHVSEPRGVAWEAKHGVVSPDRNTRLLFPLPVANLNARWCSAALKVDVSERIIGHDPRFKSGTFCVVTGERGEESTNRKRYAGLEHSSTKGKGGVPGRSLYQWRAVHRWREQDVWGIMERYGINPHPAYKLGFGRVSCMTCIFGNRTQWATIQAIAPERFERMAQYEDYFGDIDPARRSPTRLTGKKAEGKERKGVHSGAISMTKRKLRELVAGGYASGKKLREATSTDTTALDYLFRSLVLGANRYPGPEWKQEQKALITEVLENDQWLDGVASLPESTLATYHKNMTLKGLKGPIDKLFAAIQKHRFVPFIVGPARSFVTLEDKALEVWESQQTTYESPIVIEPGRVWLLPAGAYKKDGGPI